MNWKRKEISYSKAQQKKYAYEYNSYYGLNGCEKKSQYLLSKELGVSVGTISNRIKKYQEYLDSSSQEEKGQN